MVYPNTRRYLPVTNPAGGGRPRGCRNKLIGFVVLTALYTAFLYRSGGAQNYLDAGNKNTAPPGSTSTTTYSSPSSTSSPAVMNALARMRAAGRLLSVTTWNVAAINNNPFEYWITMDDNPAYERLMMDVEKFIEEPRHIEIQVAGDRYGKACHLSERDCSIQRRHQKLVEESPSPFLDDKLRRKMGDAAVKAAESIAYEGVGTIEFLTDKHRNFYFMEMNTRIQVEHPVTEEVVDFDLIKEQIKIAMGDKISGKNYFPELHAMECRINAEDPRKNFSPSPGKITSFHSPKGHGVRVDTAVYAGYTIPQYYDSMIAKLICKARTREEVILKMQRALDEFIVEGIKTTIPFHKKLMKDERFRAGVFDTSFMNSFDLSDLPE